MTSLSILLPVETRTLLRRIAAELGPVAADTYLVGGSVRDLLLGRPPRDFDLAVPGDAVGVAQRTADRLGAAFVPVGGAWGIARVALRDGGSPFLIDFSRLRGAIEDDLAERDFTMNAMAVPLSSIEASPALIDPFGGQDDLDSRIVRAVRPENLDADPLRLLRAVRFACVLEFAIAPGTAAAIRERAHQAGMPAPERIRDEFLQILRSDQAAAGLRLLDDLWLLDVLLPEITPAKGCEQPPEHYWDVFDHMVETVRVFDLLFTDQPAADVREATLQRLFWEEMGRLRDWRSRYAAEFSDMAPRSALLKLAALLHDIGKPHTKSVDPSGRTRFFGHSEVGARLAAGLLQRLRFSSRSVKYVSLLVEEHLRPTQMSSPGQPPTRRAIYRFFRDTGDAGLDVLLLSVADHAAARGPTISWELWQQHIRYVLDVLQTATASEGTVRPARLVTGDDLMQALGIGPGKLVGRLLATIEEAQAAGEIQSREEALRLARQLLAAERVA
jgi:putative nucleotidyltransferase with HDIG domain